MDLNFAAICDAVAQRRPDDECLIFRDRRFTWSHVQDRTARLANVLQAAGLGYQLDGATGATPSATGVTSKLSDRTEIAPTLRLGERVALYLLNGNEYLEGMLGAWKAGCVPFNVNYRYVADELRYLLDDAQASALIIHDRFTPVLAEVLPTLADKPRLILAVSDGTDRAKIPGIVDYETALAQADPVLAEANRSAWSGDDIYLCYTGGTTGMPKGAMWRQGDFLVAALGVRQRDGQEYESVEAVADAAKSHMRALPAPPLMHGAAHWNAMSAWIAGGTVIIQDVVDRFDPLSVLDTLERERATSLLVVGDPMARPLLDHLLAERRQGIHRDLSSLRHIVSGGAVLSGESKGRILSTVGDVRIIDVLGSTESGRQAISDSSLDKGTHDDFSASESGVVLSDDLTRRLTPGSDEIGWLAQAGRVPLGYLGDPEKSAATFPTISGVRYSIPGDRARLRADGRIELLGRESVCINTGGEKVFAEEVEGALKTHPGVYDAVVCGIPSERFGQQVAAVVAIRPGYSVTDDELRTAVSRKLARYKVPRRIVRREEILRSPSGKADYRWAVAQASYPTQQQT